MKKITFTLLLIVLTKLFVPAQGFTIDIETIKLGWNIASPFIVSEIKDPLTREIVTNTVPELIDQDIKGAVYEVSNSFYTVKGVKVLNKEFLSLLETNITKGIAAIKNKDYITAVNEIIEIVSIGDTYLNNGMLDIADKKISKTPIVNNDIYFNQSTLTEKMYVSSFNYLFFISSGKITHSETTESSITGGDEIFEITLDNEAFFHISVSFAVLDEPMYLQTLKNDQEELSLFNDIIEETLNELLGPGSILKTEFSDDYNFESIDYTYSYSDIETHEPCMSKTAIVLDGTRLYFIIFESLTEYYTDTKPAFSSLMDNFYIVGIDQTKILDDCEVNSTGSITLKNNSTNPYDVYFNNEYFCRMSGGTAKTVDVKEGYQKVYVKQVSGYLFYPTEVTKTIENVVKCKKYNISFP